MRILSFISFFIIILCAISFALLNAESVTINYFFGVRTLPLSLLLVLALFLGCLLTFLVQLKILLAQQYKIHTLNKTVKRFSQELSQLRTSPVKDPL